jgi:hypothetical protein
MATQRKSELPPTRAPSFPRPVVDNRAGETLRPSIGGHGGDMSTPRKPLKYRRSPRSLEITVDPEHSGYRALLRLGQGRRDGALT